MVLVVNTLVIVMINGVCHHVTGACICNTGYTGPCMS